MKYSAGTLPHDSLMRSIELYGTEVTPQVHELLDNADGPLDRFSERIGAQTAPDRAELVS